GRGLVEKEDARAVDEREREIEAAFHAAGVGLHLSIRGEAEADALEQLGAPLVPIPSADAVEAGLEAKVLAPGQPGIERGFLKRGADHAAHFRAFLDDVEAGDACRSRRR